MDGVPGRQELHQLRPELCTREHWARHLSKLMGGTVNGRWAGGSSCCNRTTTTICSIVVSPSPRREHIVVFLFTVKRCSVDAMWRGVSVDTAASSGISKTLHGPPPCFSGGSWKKCCHGPTGSGRSTRVSSSWAPRTTTNSTIFFQGSSQYHGGLAAHERRSFLPDGQGPTQLSDVQRVE